MEWKLIHFYPDLMNLYGSYANLLVLRRALEALGGTVTVQPVLPGQEADLADADFLFMGAGTERAQKAALSDFARYGEAIRFAAAHETPMLFAGTAMELLGKTIVDADGKSYDGIELGSFTSTQQKRRIVEDVLGTSPLLEEPVVGFINKSSLITGVETPLLGSMRLGFGNETALGPEGFSCHQVLGSHLTGPLLVKNPRLLDRVVTAMYARRGEAVPTLPRNRWAEDGYQTTVSELSKRVR